MTALACPQCNSSRFFRNGWRKLASVEKVQTYICRQCGYRFTDPTLPKISSERRLSSPRSLFADSQICAQKAKNLEPQTETKTVAGVTPQADVKGQILQFSFWMLKQAYAQATIRTRTALIKRLVKRGADLSNPESVKEVIAKQTWSNARKVIAVDTYSCLLQMQGRKWDPPIYKRIRKLPFLPTENEIDQLIGGCNHRMATFLQLLKETGVRCGEACNLHWKDLDTVNNHIIVTPEKGSNSRRLKISNKLTAMLNQLPQTSKKIFITHSDALRKSFQIQRKRIAYKLQNPRIQQITFHTFRHWKATMEYHKTRDLLHVMQILGHRSINNTLVYTRLIDFQEDEYIARIAHSEKETCELIESGFEFVCDFAGNKVFRKRK